MNSKIISVVAGNKYSLALSDKGTLLGWGNLSFIGIESIVTKPMQLGNKKYKMVSGGYEHIMLIDMNDILYGWGTNSNNYMPQLGKFGTVDGNFKNDLIEQSNLRWKSVSCGQSSTVAITLEDDMYTFGNNYWGEIGNNSTDATNDTIHKIEKVDNNSPWIKAFCGLLYTVALNQAGGLYVWGKGTSAILGNDTMPDRVLIPTKVNGLWINVIVGNSTIWAINESNQVYGWGWGVNVQDYSISIQTTPKLINNLNGANIIKINSNFQTSHFMVIYNDNSIYSWGDNNKGQLGLGDVTFRDIPTQINTPIKWVDAVGSEVHSIAVDIEGNVYTCGANDMGQLGIGSVDTDIEHYTFEKIEIVLPVDSSTDMPADIPADIPAPSPPTLPPATSPPSTIDSKSNKKKTIIIVVSVISSVVFIILLLFLFYKLNIKYKWIKKLL